MPKASTSATLAADAGVQVQSLISCLHATLTFFLPSCTAYARDPRVRNWLHAKAIPKGAASAITETFFTKTKGAGGSVYTCKICGWSHNGKTSNAEIAMDGHLPADLLSRHQDSGQCSWSSETEPKSEAGCSYRSMRHLRICAQP